MEIKEQNLLRDNDSANSENLKAFPGELYVKNVHKSFGVTKALADVSFTGYFGEIHAIIGGNGCGKSTLAKVLAGVLPIDSGKVSIKGAHPSTPKESRNLGVAMVFQEVLVADEASVVDNLFIGVDGFITKNLSDKEKQDKARELLSELADEEIDPLMPAGNLPLSIKAWITIARGLLREPDVLILDESTAALDFDSTERLFEKMRELRDKGSAVIIVSHRIAELVRISDRCTVMRDGIDVGVLEKEEVTEKNLLRLMTGKEQKADRSVDAAHQTKYSQISLKTKNMQVWPDSNKSDFELRKGEIVGVTGLDGHGHDDFVRILAGVDNAFDGFTEVNINNENKYFSIKGLDDAIKHDIEFVSGDRKREGILPNLSITENLGISMYHKFSKIPGVRFIDWGAINDVVDWEVERLAIKTGPRENLITSLSGGNQQKVMLGRAFATQPKILILLDPARGIDLHTKLDLYKQLREFADDGNSVIYMSSELEEFIGFCSRVVVFREGSIFETFINEQINADGILESMFGHRQNPSFEKELNSQSTEKNNDQTKLKNLTNKKQSDNKLETEVKKHNISNYFNKKTEKISPVIATKTGFSAKDEEQFNNILNSTKKNSYKEKFDQKQKNDQYQEKYDYSENDSKKFEELIASGEQLIRKKGKSSYRNNKNKETYSISDEELFNKHLSLNQDNSHTQNLDKKAAKINKEQLFNREHNSSESKTFEYNEKDVAQFEKLMSKK
jgi:ribose transport system ATP-binding protein|tara:strand:- start:1393 stop:3591 length:2199 start_codon:yes stop_codon:yes gene_type:complete